MIFHDFPIVLAVVLNQVLVHVFNPRRHLCRVLMTFISCKSYNGGSETKCRGRKSPAKHEGTRD